MIDLDPNHPRVSGTPTTRQRALRAAAEQLTPMQALDAVDQASTRITGAVTLAGAIAAGLGLVSASRLARVDIAWALPSVLAAAVTVALAVTATVPVRATLRPGDMSAMEWWFGRQIKRRVTLIRLSAACLALAVLTAALPAVVSTIRDPKPQVDVTLVANEGIVTVHTSGSGLPEDATLRVLVTNGRAALARALVDANSSGSARSLLRVRVETRQVVKAEVAAGKDSGEIRSRTVAIEVP